MSLVHTRTDHPELLMCLVPPKNPERRKRMLESFVRREAPNKVKPKISQPVDRSAFLRWCFRTGFPTYTMKFWPVGKKYSGRVLNFSFGSEFYHEKRPKTMREIMEEVAEKYGITAHDIKSACRRRDMIVPRHEFFYRARTETLNSYPAIGRYCGDRDHTTAIHGVKKHALINGLKMPGEAE